MLKPDSRPEMLFGCGLRVAVCCLRPCCYLPVVLSDLCYSRFGTSVRIKYDAERGGWGASSGCRMLKIVGNHEV